MMPCSLSHLPLLFSALVTIACLEAAPLVYHDRDPITVDFSAADERRSLAQAVNARGESAFLLQTYDAAGGTLHFDLHAYGAWQGSFFSSSFAEFPAIQTVQMKLLPRPDGSFVGVLAYIGFIQQIQMVTWGPEGYRDQQPLAGFANPTLVLDAIALADGNIAVVTDVNGTRLRVMIWDGEQIIDSFDTPQLAAGSFSSASIAETSTGGIAVAAWHNSEDAGIRTYELRYLSAPRPFAGTPSWQAVHSNAQQALEANITPGVSLAMQPNLLPFIIHSDSIDSTVMSSRFTFFGWETENIDAFPPFHRSLEAYLDDQDRPAAAWTRGGGFDPFTAHRSGSSWSAPEALAHAATTDIGAFATDRDGFLHYSGISEDGGLPIRSYSPLDTTDLDGDGIVYLLEDGFRSDPDSAASSALPEFEVSAGGHMSFTFEAPSDIKKFNNVENGILISAAESMFFNIQMSDDLATWTQASNLLDTDIFTVNGRKFIVAEQVDPIGGGAKRYMRVEVLRYR